MNVALIIIAIITSLTLLILVSGIYSAIAKVAETYNAKAAYESRNISTVMTLSYANIIEVLDNIIDTYVSEYTILNALGDEYLTDKEIIKIIEKISVNILEDISEDVYIMCSSCIKSEKIPEVINRRVVIAVTSLANRVNDSIKQDAEEPSKREHLNNIIREINNY